MKKLLFFSVTLGLLVGVNAQTRNGQIEAVPVQKQTIEKLDKNVQKQLAPSKDAGILGNYNYYTVPEFKSKSIHKNVTYNSDSGFWAANTLFALNEYGGEMRDMAAGLPIYLFPDSLAFAYSYVDVGDSLAKANYEGKHGTYASIGFVFDPYSKSFDNYGFEGLLTNSDGTVGYGYRLDTLQVQLIYDVPKGHTFVPGMEDSLYFHLTYLKPYIKDADSIYYYHAWWTNGPFRDGDGRRRDLIAPRYYYNYPEGSDAPRKGLGAHTLATENKTIAYALTAKDTATYSGEGGKLYHRATIPVEGGFPVPVGGCLGIIAEYCPKFQYEYPDTLGAMHFDFSRPEGQEVTEDSIYKPMFMFCGWNPRNKNQENKVLSFFDAGGYNTFLSEPMSVRYGSLSIAEWSFDSNAIKWGTYVGDVYNHRLWAWMRFSIAENDSARFVPLGITDYSKTLITNIYPNPATTQLTIDLNEAGNANVIIYNILGQAVLEETLNDMSNKINIANLSSGMYTVKVTQNGRTHTVKVAKK